MKKSVFAFSFIMLFASTVPAQSQAVPQQVAVEKIPWPAPDAWTPNRHEEYKNGHWLTAEKLLTSKSVYVQSALPPEEAGAPKWVAQRYKVVGPDDAELFVFVKSTMVSRDPEISLAESVSNVMNGKIDQRPKESFAVYSILVTDRDGVRVQCVHGDKYVMAAWKELLRMTLYEENYQKKHAQK